MEKLIRGTSSFLFGCNYAGIVCGAISFIRESEAKQNVFKLTAACHCGFLINNYLITFMKFRAYPYHLSLQVLNDFGCFITCFPMYALWAKNDFHKYFDKVPARLPDSSEPFDPS